MTLYVSADLSAGAHSEALRCEKEVIAILWVCEEAAYPYADTLLDQALALTPAKHPYRVILLKRRGKLYREQGRFGESASVYQQALSLAEEQLGLAHVDTRRVRDKICKLHERMMFRSGLTQDDQNEHIRLSEQCFLSARERALQAGDAAVAAILLGDLAAFWHGLYQRCHHSRQPERYRRAVELSQQAVSELVQYRQQLPEALQTEPGRACASLGFLFADNYATREALEEWRRAVRLLGRNHPWYESLAWHIRDAEYQLYGDDDNDR